jgi:hypothetical protein
VDAINLAEIVTEMPEPFRKYCEFLQKDLASLSDYCHLGDQSILGRKSCLLIFEDSAASKLPTPLRAADQKLIVSY